MVILLQNGDREAERIAEYVLEESGERIDLRKGWSARKDNKAFDSTQDHVHIYLRNNQVAVVNRDGTPSHNSDLNLVPSRIFKALKKIDFLEGSLNILQASADSFVVPRDVMQELCEILERRAKYARIMREIGHPR